MQLSYQQAQYFEIFHFVILGTTGPSSGISNSGSSRFSCGSSGFSSGALGTFFVWIFRTKQPKESARKLNEISQEIRYKEIC